MTTRLHSTNDITNDEFYARKLQQEEEQQLRLDANKTRAAFFRKRIRDQEEPMQVDNEEEPDIIVIDDDVPSERTNSRTSNRSPLQNNNPITKDTENDELLARKLQEEYDKEFAARLSRTENNSSNAYNLRPQTTNSTIPPNRNLSNYNFRQREPTNARIPDSFETDMLFNMARDRSMRTSNNNATTSTTDNNNGEFLLLGSDLNRRRNSNNDPVTSLANAFNFLQNQQFMNDFLVDDEQPNQRSGNNSNNNNRSNINNNETFSTRVANFNHFRRPTVIPTFTGRGRPTLPVGRGRHNLYNLLTNQGDFTADDYESLLRLDEINSVKKCLSRQEIESLPTFDFKENQESPEENTCSICYEVYAKKEKITSLACFHKFHKNCIKEWLKQSRQCPLCKKDAINGN